MDSVTQITFHKSWVDIIFNGTRRLRVSVPIFKQFRLSEGQMVDLKNYLPLIATEQKKEALKKAVAYIAFKDRTSKEIITYLQTKCYAPSVVSHVLERLEKEHFISDSAFAERFILSKTQAGLGKARIIQALAQKGVARPLAERIYVQCINDEDITQNANHLAQKLAKRYETLDFNSKQKIVQAMMRKGFSLSQALDAIKTLQ